VFTPTTDYGKALNIRGHLSFYAATLGDVRRSPRHPYIAFSCRCDSPPLQVRVGAQITGNLGTADYAISINDVRFVWCVCVCVCAMVRVCAAAASVCVVSLNRRPALAVRRLDGHEDGRVGRVPLHRRWQQLPRLSAQPGPPCWRPGTPHTTRRRTKSEERRRRKNED